MTKKLTFQKLSDELETIVGSELYALKGGFGGGYSDDPQNIYTMTRIDEADPYEYNNGSGTIMLDVYEVRFASGNTILAHKAPPGTPMNGSSNCLGYALTNGEYFLIDQDINASTIADFGYEVCLKSQATLAVVYNGNVISHAGKYDAMTDTYDAKGGTSSHYIRTDMYINDFYRPYDLDSDPNNDVNYATDATHTVYYRLKNPANGY